jgi:hypothetical protein
MTKIDRRCLTLSVILCDKLNRIVSLPIEATEIVSPPPLPRTAVFRGTLFRNAKVPSPDCHLATVIIP